MSSFGRLEEGLVALERRGFKEAEVYAKRGRSRRVVVAGERHDCLSTREEGWAVRAADRRRSLFVAGPGAFAVGALPTLQPEAPPFRLPDPRPLPPWTPPPELDAPLLSESEALALLAAVARELERELPGARLLSAALDDGTSEAELANSRELRAAMRARLATLRLEARIERGAVVVLELCEREAKRFRPPALARRLADRLHLSREGRAPEHPGGELVLAPTVAARLLAALAPHLAGPEALERLAPLRDVRGHVAAGCVTVLDDGRLLGGVFAAPVDGEGVPTGAAVLIEDGVLRQPLLAWWEARPPQVATGCVRRASFRDLPAKGFSHLVLRPSARLHAAELIAGVDHGYYLLDTEGPVDFDLARDRLTVPVCGYALRGGRAVAPMSGGWLCGSLHALFGGVVAVGRELEWLVTDAAYGAPTLLASGLEVRPTPA